MNGSPIPTAMSASPQHNGSGIVSMEGKRILCTADIRGNISQLNQLARDTRADYIIHTGDFGFYERSSLSRISDRTLKHLVQYSTLIPPTVRNRLNNSPIDQVRRTIEQSPQPFLSEFPEFLAAVKRLEVPVYAVWGACEDVAVLEKFRSREYQIQNLHILDEATTYLLEIGGISLRLFGLGGAVVQHKLFDNGEGSDTIAGGSGTMWTTALQIGELVETAQEVYDPTETRMLVTHASPGREGLLAQLALSLRADFTVSAGLHFRYGISYNEFACQPDQDHYRNRLLHSQQSFLQLWSAIKEQVESYVDDRQAALLQNALQVVNRVPPSQLSAEPSVLGERDEQAFKNMWNFNLPDAAFGWVVLDINQGRVSSETKSQGFNFSYRRSSNNTQATASPALSATGIYTDKPHQYKSNDWQPDKGSVDNDSGSVKDEKMSIHSSSNSISNNNNRNSRRMSMRNPYAIYVGGLMNNSVTEDDIRNFFGNDVVTGVRFPLDQTTQMPKSHCYVDLIDPVALENALSKNGQILKDNKLTINKPNSSEGRGRSGRGRGRGFRGNRDSVIRTSREPSTVGDSL